MLLALSAKAQYQIQWQAEIPSPLVDMVVAKDGRLYEAGLNFVKQFNASGSEMSSVPVSGGDMTSIQIEDNVIVALTTPSITMLDFSGAENYKQNFYWFGGYQLAFKKATFYKGSFYLMCHNKFLLKYSQGAVQRWQTEVGQGSNEQMRISDNHIYLYSVIYDPPGSGGILKYDTLGNRIWRADPGMFVRSIVTDEQGNCFVLGAKIDGISYVRKLSSAGNELWTIPVPSFTPRNGFVKGDSLFVCGSSFQQKDNDPVLSDDEWESGVAIISSSTGQLINTLHYDLFAGRHEELQHIAATDDAIYIGGIHAIPLASTTAFVAKLADLRYVSIKENQPQQNISVFPNPARDEVFLTFPAGTESTIDLQLYDQLGKKIAEQHYKPGGFESGTYSIKAPGARGVYFLKVKEGANVYSQKVVFE